MTGVSIRPPVRVIDCWARSGVSAGISDSATSKGTEGWHGNKMDVRPQLLVDGGDA